MKSGRGRRGLGRCAWGLSGLDTRTRAERGYQDGQGEFSPTAEDASPGHAKMVAVRLPVLHHVLQLYIDVEARSYGAGQGVHSRGAISVHFLCHNKFKK